MEFAGTGLDDHGDSSSRGEAVVGAIVRSQLAKLGHRLARRSRGDASSASAIVVLAAVYHVNIMSGALAVEADVGIAANRDILIIRDVVRCSGSQCSKLE